MKKYIYLLLLILTGYFWLGCNGLDEVDLNPNSFLGNPTFDVTVDTTNINTSGGERTLSVKTNTEWWTIKSNQSWVKVTSDTIRKDGEVKIEIELNQLTETREATLTLQSGTVGPKREIRLIQDGLPSTIKVTPQNIDTDALGGFFEINVESNSSWKVEIQMDQDTELNWCTVDYVTGSNNGKVTIKVEKNVNVKLDLRTATIKFIANGAVQTVELKQLGNAACDNQGNTDVIYFDSFIPCDNSEVGDTWTLTDRRDGKTYKVRMMEDKQIWMIEDLRFSGNTGKQKANLSLFNGDGIPELEMIVGYLGDVVSPNVKAFPTETGYFYNWMGVMQDPKAVDAGKSQSFVVTEPYRGIAPFGWHVPSSKEFKRLDTAFGSDPVKWGPTGVWRGAYGGNVNETATSHWGINVYGSYWTCTQTSTTETSSNPNQKAHIWKFYSNKSASEVVVTQPKKYGFTVRLVKNK